MNAIQMAPQLKTDSRYDPECTAALQDDPIERRLIQQIAESEDIQAFDALYARYSRKLAGLFKRMMGQSASIDEAYNDVMWIVWRKAKQFNGESKVSTWVYSIAYRHTLSLLRKEKKHSLDELPEHMADHQSDAIDDQDLIKKALAYLSHEHRSVIELVYFSGHNYQEVATIMSTSENTVKTRMFYARRKLKDIINQLSHSQLTK